jgi:hypothetical protein
VTIKRLLTGSSFAPESVAVIAEAYEAALLELKIAPDDEEAKSSLAKLALEIAAPLTELDRDALLDKLTMAWSRRNPPGAATR